MGELLVSQVAMPIESTAMDSGIVVAQTPLPTRPRSWGTWLVNGLWRWGLRIGFVYVGLLLVLLALEDWMIYPRPPAAHTTAAYPRTEVWLTAADGARIHGWFCDADAAGVKTDPTTRRTVLYCHGNGDVIDYLLPTVRQWQTSLAADVFVFDYRGYGRSPGKPSEQGLSLDARAAYEYLTVQRGVDPSRLVVVGRSLGGAVALELAVQRPAQALVLESTFTSMPDVAARLFPWLPVRWVMRNRYPSLARIEKLAIPVFFSHGQDDDLIPVSHGVQLHAAARPPKKLVIFPNSNHNTPLPATYFTEVGDFLRQHVGR